MAERRTITPSEVLLVYWGGPPKNSDPEASRAGMEAHQLLRQRIEDGKPPKCLEGICERSPRFEQTRRITIGADGLEISARIDVLTERAVVEIKPRPVRKEHWLQAAIECRAANRPTAVIYGYEKLGHGEGEVVVIRDVGGLGDQVDKVCRGARRILDLQGQIDKERKHPVRSDKTVRGVAGRNRGDPIGFACEVEKMGQVSGAHRKSLGYEIVDERREFDRNVRGVLAELGERVKRNKLGARR